LSENRKGDFFDSHCICYAQFVMHEGRSVSDVVKRSAIVSADLNSAIARLYTSASRLSISETTEFRVCVCWSRSTMGRRQRRVHGLV